MTLLIPAARGAAIERLRVEDENGVACAIEHGVYRDIAVLSARGGEAIVEGIRFRGEFCWVRLEAGEVRHVFASEGGGVVPEEAVCAQFAAS